VLNATLNTCSLAIGLLDKFTERMMNIFWLNYCRDKYCQV